MGLLDDAIREHLELKRRRGADPAEVARAEQEALGPVRRQPQGAEDLDLAPDDRLGEDDGLLYEDELEDGWEEQPLEPSAPEPEATYHEDYDHAVPGLEESLPASPDDYLYHPGEAPVAPPATASDYARHAAELVDQPPAFPRPHPAEQLGEETAEYEVEFEHRPDREDADDVLEETPEFFQDAPDHDRLWFEQRPPRDFNFDS